MNYFANITGLKNAKNGQMLLIVEANVIARVSRIFSNRIVKVKLYDKNSPFLVKPNQTVISLNKDYSIFTCSPEKVKFIIESIINLDL